MSATLTVRLSQTIKKRLESLAKSTRRSKSFLAGEAIADFVAVQEWHIGRIEESIRLVERQGTVSHKEVVGWIQSRGTRRSNRRLKTRQI